MSKTKKFILWFDEISIEDVPLVGGKNASLGEMYRNLTKEGVKIPNGFAVTAYAYNYFLEKARSNGFQVEDLQPDFIQHYRLHHQKFEFVDDAHWNGIGHEVFANAIARSELFKRLFEKD